MNLRNDNQTVEEVKELVALFKQKPEIDRKVTFFKESLLALDNQLDNLQDRISRGKREIKYSFFGLPITSVERLDSYEIGKLRLEKLQIENDMFSKKQYYELWLQRSKEYEVKYEETTKECNEYFDAMLKKANEVSEKNFRLADGIDKYSNPNNDQKLKNEFFLYMKREVSNFYKYGKENK